VKRFDTGMLCQQCANNIALHAFAFAVDQAHFAEAGLFTLLKMLFDDAGNIFRVKRMEIEVILDGNDNWIDEWRAVFATGDTLII
jgi:hypothetical protein